MPCVSCRLRPSPDHGRGALFHLGPGLRRPARAHLAELRPGRRLAFAIHVCHRRHFGLGPIGLIKLAAFFGALKLAVAGFCAVHLLDRLRVLIGGKADNEILEGGLILVVLISILSVGPAIWSQNAELVREQAIQLMLAAIATALCLLERNRRPGRKPSPPCRWNSPPRRAARPGTRRSARARAPNSLRYLNLAVARPQGMGYLAFASSAITSAASLKAWLAAGTPQ